MDMKFCQSCGMPLETAEHFGTNKDNSPNEEYCNYCFKEGEFTQDVTMDEMIDICAQYTDQWKTEDGKPVTKEDAIAQMKQFFPHLKRWAKA